jgi:hypothetical protein
MFNCTQNKAKSIGTSYHMICISSLDTHKKFPTLYLHKLITFGCKPRPAQIDAIRQNGLHTPFGRQRAWGQSSVEHPGGLSECIYIATTDLVMFKAQYRKKYTLTRHKPFCQQNGL